MNFREERNQTLSTSIPLDASSSFTTMVSIISVSSTYGVKKVSCYDIPLLVEPFVFLIKEL